MATLYVENVPDEVYEALRAQAKSNRRSIAAELMCARFPIPLCCAGNSDQNTTDHGPIRNIAHSLAGRLPVIWLGALHSTTQ